MASVECVMSQGRSLPGLTDATVLVTGGSRGLGAAIAAAFVNAGATTHILAETDEVIATADAIRAIGHIADVTDTTSVQSTIQKIGPLDILVNNAGLERATPVIAIDDQDIALFRKILDVNVTGMMIVTGHVLPKMKQRGRIINTASVWGRVAEPLFGAYVASKHAVIGLTKTWARELGQRDIRVNAVCPGWVETQASLRSAEAIATKTGQERNDVLKDVAALQALPSKLMKPADIAGPYLFLASTLSENITGQTLGIDRGEAPW